MARCTSFLMISSYSRRTTPMRSVYRLRCSSLVISEWAFSPRSISFITMKGLSVGSS
jgi:hypothetical protein